MQLANDMAKYHLTAMAIQETKLKKEGVFEINTSDNRKSYEVYHTGSEENKHYGVGIITEKGLDVEFKTVSNRTCTATIKLKGKDKKKGKDCEACNHINLCSNFRNQRENTKSESRLL